MKGAKVGEVSCFCEGEGEMVAGVQRRRSERFIRRDYGVWSIISVGPSDGAPSGTVSSAGVNLNVWMDTDASCASAVAAANRAVPANSSGRATGVTAQPASGVSITANG